ncbi:MAG: DUF3667 domain-containing protein [Proteobacteria bacterium]|nr:DUF3667 domain-containing protein [Pseudomonadota bacterium]
MMSVPLDPNIVDESTPVQVRFPNCANCGALASDKFCPKCGQETLSEPPTVADFLRMHIRRYATWEGMFWQTFSKLFFAPGSLTVEYAAGRRSRYLRPLQLYLTASVIVFATAQLFGLSLELRLLGDYGIHLVRASSLVEDENIRGSRLMPAQIIADYVDTPAVREFKSMSREDRFRFLRARRVQYVSYFVLLLVPLYAAILKLCYIDRRRRYAEHLVFGLHAHSFLLFMLLIEAKLPTIAADALSLWVIAYFVIALKRVFGGTWIETVGRGTAMLTLYFATFFVGNLLLVLALIQI